MSYKTCPGSMSEIKENIEICNNLISELEKRDKEINEEITKSFDQEETKLMEETERIKGLLMQWNNNRDENLNQLNEERKILKVRKV